MSAKTALALVAVVCPNLAAQTQAVLVLLRDQPQRAVMEWAEGASALRRHLAEGDWNRAANRIAASEEEIALAQERLDRITLETRQMAAAGIAARTAPSQGSVRARMEALGARGVRGFTFLNLLAGEIPVGAIGELAAHPDVALVIPDEVYRGQLDVSTAAMGVNAFWSRSFTGAGESAAILDSGLNSAHPAFAGRRIVSRVFSTAAARNTLCFDDQADSADDKDGHGTHVAGIVASGGSPSFPAVTGVAKGLSNIYVLKTAFRSKELPGQCMGGTGGIGADLIAAIDWAAANTPVKIFNYSAGSAALTDDPGMSQIFDYYAETLDMLFVVAAGNSGPAPGTVAAPSIAFNVLSVANLDDRNTSSRSDDVVAASSSRGPTIRGRAKPDLAAPGTLINSARHDSTGFVNLSGTSMAAPHVAGAAVLVYQAGLKHPLPVRALLINTADASSGWEPGLGWGVVNLTRAQTEMNAVVRGTIAPGSVRFYRGTARADLKATLAWNRHVSISGQSIQASLNNLNLEAYSREGSALVRSDTNLNSVEQVRTTIRGEMLLKVKAEPAFLGGVTSEPFALAISEAGFTEIGAPVLSATCRWPASVAPGATFTLSCDVLNSGAMQASGVSGALEVPTGFPAVPPVNVETIAGGGRILATFTVRAPANPGQFALSAAFTSNLYGETFRAAAPIAVAVGGGNLTAVTVSVPRIDVSYRTGEPAPEPRTVQIGISAGSGSYSASATGTGGWLAVSPASGALPATLRIVIDPSRLAAGNHSGSVVVTAAGASNSPFTIPVNVSVHSTSSVRLDTRMLSKTVPAGTACTAPAPATSFLPTDARAYVWFNVSNTAAGDRPSMEWFAPDGTVHQTGEWQPVASAGGWCFWGSMPIAGATAAAKRGNWRVRVAWNATELFTLPFTIDSPITVRRSVVATEADASSPCTEPAAATRILTTDRQVFFWFLLDGTSGGETIRYEFLNPGRQTAASGRWNPLEKGGSWCFVSNAVRLANTANANQPGIWTVNLFVAEALVMTRTFTLVKGFTLESRLMTKDVPEGCIEPDRTTTYFRGDPRANVWFLVSNPSAGDAAIAEFVKPDGEVYSTVTWDAVGEGGRSQCFWAWIAIAGQDPASIFGEWKVRVSWNGAPLFTEGFHIVSVEVPNRMTTKVVPEGAGCPVPSPTRTFTTSDEAVIVWFIVRGAKAGEAPRADFHDPSERRTTTFTWQPLPTDGNFCFRATYPLTSAGASALGSWTIRVFWNNVFLFSQPYTIAEPSVSETASYLGAMKVREETEQAGEVHRALEEVPAHRPEAGGARRGAGQAVRKPGPGTLIRDASPAPPPSPQ